MSKKKPQGFIDWKEKNRKAFEEVIGDPFSIDGKIGAYNVLKQKGSLSVIDYSAQSTGTPNAAKPSESDFFCDVELIIKKELNSVEQTLFWETYLKGLSVMTLQERLSIEQRLGKLFRINGISPTKQYFTSIRRKL